MLRDPLYCGEADSSAAISEAQANQDTVSATTLLSAPFFGACEVYKDTANPATTRDRLLSDNLTLAASNFQGSHWFVYEGGSDGIHAVRWLDPWNYGPFDHAWVTVEEKGADMLTFNEDGVVGGDTDTQFEDWDLNAFLFVARDVDNGNVEYEAVVPTDGERRRDRGLGQTVFNSNNLGDTARFYEHVFNLRDNDTDHL